MELLFLGTGAGVPGKLRNVSSIALKLLEERSAIWLFDCGEATQHQVLYTTLKPRRLEKIFITHLHGDHIFGLPGLLSSRSFQGGTSELTIYGPKGIRAFVDTALQVSATHLKYSLNIVEIEEGLIFEDEQFRVDTKPLIHGVSCFGYRITEKDKPGMLDALKLREDGVPPGPIYQLLKDGQSVELADGRFIDGNNYLGPVQKGRVVTILGDTRPCDNAVSLAEDADVLVHEATFMADSAEMAHTYFHSTTTQAAQVAQTANAQMLVLTHISSRYGKEEWSEMVEEAKLTFPRSLMAYDLLEIDIPYRK